jgi:hypothetical protein
MLKRESFSWALMTPFKVDLKRERELYLPHLVISACCTSSYLEMLAKLTAGVCDCFFPFLEENKDGNEVEVNVDVEVKKKTSEIVPNAVDDAKKMTILSYR